MMAGPTSFMTVFRSAKSTLMCPGRLIRSVMPLTAWSRTLSTISIMLTRVEFLFIRLSSRSLGTVMIVSEYCLSFSQPASALRIRFFASK